MFLSTVQDDEVTNTATIMSEPIAPLVAKLQLTFLRGDIYRERPKLACCLARKVAELDQTRPADQPPVTTELNVRFGPRSTPIAPRSVGQYPRVFIGPDWEPLFRGADILADR